MVRDVSKPNEEGKEPVNLFVYRKKYANDAKVPISEGIDPTKEFASKRSPVRAMSEQNDTSKTVISPKYINLVNPATIEGIVPERLLYPKFRKVKLVNVQRRDCSRETIGTQIQRE